MAPGAVVARWLPLWQVGSTITLACVRRLLVVLTVAAAVAAACGTAGGPQLESAPVAPADELPSADPPRAASDEPPAPIAPAQAPETAATGAGRDHCGSSLRCRLERRRSRRRIDPLGASVRAADAAALAAGSAPGAARFARRSGRGRPTGRQLVASGASHCSVRQPATRWPSSTAPRSRACRCSWPRTRRAAACNDSPARSDHCRRRPSRPPGRCETSDVCSATTGGLWLDYGVDVAFAPVVDVGGGPGIGDRAFSDDPAVVSRYGTRSGRRGTSAAASSRSSSTSPVTGEHRATPTSASRPRRRSTSSDAPTSFPTRSCSTRFRSSWSATCSSRT